MAVNTNNQTAISLSGNVRIHPCFDSVFIMEAAHFLKVNSTKKKLFMTLVLQCHWPGRDFHFVSLVHFVNATGFESTCATETSHSFT